MSAEPIVSVIIASHNAVTTIGDTLESLERQTARGQCEIIVADSSTDGTGAFGRRSGGLCARLELKHWSV